MEGCHVWIMAVILNDALIRRGQFNLQISLIRALVMWLGEEYVYGQTIIK